MLHTVRQHTLAGLTVGLPTHLRGRLNQALNGTRKSNIKPIQVWRKK